MTGSPHTLQTAAHQRRVSVVPANLASLWFGLDWLGLHGGDRLLSAAQQTVREDEVNTLISVAMTIEQEEATSTVYMRKRGGEAKGLKF